MKLIKRYRSFFAFMTLWLVLLLWFWIFGVIGNEMLYSIIAFYILMPLASSFSSFKVAKNNAKNKIFFMLLFGIMSLVLPWLTFGVIFGGVELVIAFVPTILGYALGALNYNHLKNKNR